MKKPIILMLFVVLCLNIVPVHATQILDQWNILPTEDTFISSSNADTIYGNANNLNLSWNCIGVGNTELFFRFKNVGKKTFYDYNNKLVSRSEGQVPYFSQLTTYVSKNTQTCTSPLTTECGYSIESTSACNWKENTMTWNNVPYSNFSVRRLTDGTFAGYNNIGCADKSNTLVNMTSTAAGHNFTCGSLTAGNNFWSDLFGATSPITDSRSALWSEVAYGMGINNVELKVKNSPGYGNGLVQVDSKEGITPPLLTVGTYWDDNWSWFYNNQTTGVISTIYYNPSYLAGDTTEIRMTIGNVGNETKAFKVGLSIGNIYNGFCDQSCYVDNTTPTDAYGNKWFAILNVSQNSLVIVSRNFTFNPAVFRGGTYDIVSTLRPITTNDVVNNYLVSDAINIPKIDTNSVFNSVFVYPFNEWGFPTPAGVSIDNSTYVTTDTTVNSQGVQLFRTQFSSDIATLGKHSFSAIDYASNGRRATMNVTIASYPTYIRLNLTPYNTCVPALFRGTQWGCEDSLKALNQYSPIPYTAAFCRYNPDECNLFNFTTGVCSIKAGERNPPESWILYRCYNGYLPSGVSPNQTYDINFNIITGQNQSFTTGTSSTAAGQLATSFGSGFGFNINQSLAFMSVFIILISCIFLQATLKSVSVTGIAAACEFLMFTVVGWFPIWLFVVLTILAGLGLANFIRKSSSG